MLRMLSGSSNLWGATKTPIIVWQTLKISYHRLSEIIRSKIQGCWKTSRKRMSITRATSPFLQFIRNEKALLKMQGRVFMRLEPKNLNKTILEWLVHHVILTSKFLQSTATRCHKKRKNKSLTLKTHFRTFNRSLSPDQTQLASVQQRLLHQMLWEFLRTTLTLAQASLHQIMLRWSSADPPRISTLTKIKWVEQPLTTGWVCHLSTPTCSPLDISKNIVSRSLSPACAQTQNDSCLASTWVTSFNKWLPTLRPKLWGI